MIITVWRFSYQAIRAAGLAILLLFELAGVRAQAGNITSAAAAYEYSDTREMVLMVEDAARLLEDKGEDAFDELSLPDSRWKHDSSYIYVYSVNGDCLFNSGQPELVGKNLRDYHDEDGRNVVRELMDIASEPEENAAGWVFFLFQDGNVISPVWKLSYNMKARLPDGRVVVVGSGRSSLKMERSFVTDRVEKAASLLQAQGRDVAFKSILDPASRFNFLGSYVFVLDQTGHTLVDPSFPNMPGRDLSGMTDAIGRSYIQELLTKIAHSDTASMMFFWRANPNDVPQRKAIYARKVTVNGADYIVGAEYLLPTPLWMK